MPIFNLTSGAERTLQRLRNESPELVSSGRMYLFLLVALFEDEGRAASLLHAVLESLDDVHAALEQTALASEELMPFGDWSRQVIRRADHFAIECNAEGGTSSEHLLLAAVEQSALVAAVLQTRQCSLETLLDQTMEMPPDLQIGPDSFVQIRPVEQGTLETAALYRILDASANRCREGLRVIEDYVRFRLDDAVLQRELKQIRHLLTDILRHLRQDRWVPGRDSERDVGRRGALASERSRESLHDVVRASFKRVEEALRSLEEYGKLIDADLALRLTECRFRMYTVEKVLETGIHSRSRLEDCRLCLLVTAANCRYSPEIVIRNSLEKGVDMIQIREKEMPDRQLVDYARQVRTWTQEFRALLMINDRADIAATVGADGVHLGQDDLDVASARRILGGSGIIGVSTHCPEQAQAATFDGADYLGVGPVFVSQTKEFPELAGLEYVAQAAAMVSLPWFAIGGITPANLGLAQANGAKRIAVSSVICQAPDPRGITFELAQRLRPRRIPPEE